MGKSDIMIEKDKWLSDVLDRDCYNLQSFKPSILSALFPSIIMASDQNKDLMVSTKIWLDGNDNSEAVMALSSLGFYSVEINLLYELRPADYRYWKIHEEVFQIEEICPDNFFQYLSDIAWIANTCFHFSRFHLDPELKDQADRVKLCWAVAGMTKERGDKMMITLFGNQTVGFLLSKVKGTVATIDLIGVHPGLQGRGVGRFLVNWFIQNYFHYEKLRVSTQISNVQARRLYGACGFKWVKSSQDYHFHIKRRQRGIACAG